MNVAAKLMKCRVNTIYFIKHHKIFFKYFEENKAMIPWKHFVHEVFCTCEDFISYFSGE